MASLTYVLGFVPVNTVSLALYVYLACIDTTGLSGYASLVCKDVFLL